MNNIKNSEVSFYNFLLMGLMMCLSWNEKIAPIVIIFITGFSLYLRIKYKINQVSSIAYIFLAIFLYYIFRLDWGNDLNEGLKFIEKNLIFFIAPVFVLPKIINQKKVLGAFAISFSIICLYVLIQLGLNYITNTQNDVKWYFQDIEKFGFHSTYMAIFALFSCVIFDSYKLFRRNWINYTFVGVNIFFILVSASRIALICLFFLLLIRLLVQRKRVYIILFTFSSLLAIGAYSISDDFKYKIDQLSAFKGFDYYDNNDYGSVSVRVAKFKAAYNVWQKHFWIGSGTGNLKNKLIKEYRSKDIECWPCAQREYNPHSQYLSVLSGHGVIGFILFSLLIMQLLYKCKVDRNYILFELVIIFLVCGLTESVLERQRGLLFFILLFYILFSCSSHQIELKKPS